MDRTGTLVVSPVTADRLPMAPPSGGALFGVPAWTIQPAGTRFDPPIEVTLPNSTAQPAGDNLPIVQWDHDLGQFVPMGRATVTEDGAYLITDAGSGVTKAGWGGLARRSFAGLLCAVCHDDLVNDRLLTIDRKGKRCHPFAIEEDGASAADVALGPVSGLHLPVNHIPFPPVPQNLRVLIGDVWEEVLPVEEDENVVAEDRKQITQFLPVVLVRIRVAPELQERALAEIRKQALGRCYSTRRCRRSLRVGLIHHSSLKPAPNTSMYYSLWKVALCLRSDPLCQLVPCSLLDIGPRSKIRSRPQRVPRMKGPARQADSYRALCVSDGARL